MDIPKGDAGQGREVKPRVQKSKDFARLDLPGDVHPGTTAPDNVKPPSREALARLDRHTQFGIDQSKRTRVLPPGSKDWWGRGPQMQVSDNPGSESSQSKFPPEFRIRRKPLPPDAQRRLDEMKSAKSPIGVDFTSFSSENNPLHGREEAGKEGSLRESKPGDIGSVRSSVIGVDLTFLGSNPLYGKAAERTGRDELRQKHIGHHLERRREPRQGGRFILPQQGFVSDQPRNPFVEEHDSSKTSSDQYYERRDMWRQEVSQPNGKQKWAEERQHYLGNEVYQRAYEKFRKWEEQYGGNG